MAKKFVKSDMFSNNKYPDKPDKARPNPYPPQDRPRGVHLQYAGKSDTLDLRKYF